MRETVLFAAALGIETPWLVTTVEFDRAAHTLTIDIDFKKGTRFAVADAEGEHPVHDTVTKTYRHLNFFQHECFLNVRLPRVKQPNGSVRLVEPEWAGRLSGFTLLFEALVLMFCRRMTFSDVAKTVNISLHRVMAICERYVDLAVDQADLSGVVSIAVDETSKQKGHKYVTLVADADKTAVIFVADGRDAATLDQFNEELQKHGGSPRNIESASIDMSTSFIAGIERNFPEAQITFDKFHVIAHASTAVDETRRKEQKNDPDLKGMRWTLLKDASKLSPEDRADLDDLIRQAPSKRTARAWLYREQLREILQRKQPNVVTKMLRQWCTNVMRSKVEAMKKVAKMIRSHFDGIVAWTRSRQTNGFLEAINGLFQAAKRKARGFGRFKTIRMVIFLIAGKLDFTKFNPKMVELPT
jgi:transposase